MIFIRNNLIQRNDIEEEIRQITNSKTDYITPTGIVYKQVEHDLFFKKSNHINNHNGYVYCNITFSDGKNRSRRIHRLIANAYLDNPCGLLVVGHRDNNKQNNSINNLYWTTTQENTQKAVDDKLLVNDIGIENIDSQPLKVISIENNYIIGVYGSISEATRFIENLSKSYLAKILKRNGDYKSRGKKYKYIPISKDEYYEFSDELKNRKLIENIVDKSPKIFKATNVKTGKEIISDNQTQFAKDFELDQASISNAIKYNDTYDCWKFELISATTYKEASSYSNLINTIDDITIENIHTKEKMTFNTKQDLKDYFNIKGHDINHLIFSEWKIINT